MSRPSIIHHENAFDVHANMMATALLVSICGSVVVKSVEPMAVAVTPSRPDTQHSNASIVNALVHVLLDETNVVTAAMLAARFTN